MSNFIVFDIGGSSVKWAVMNDEGNDLQQGKMMLPETIEEFFEKLCDIVNNKKNEYDVKGVAISAPGAVNGETGIIGGMSAVPYIHGPNFKEIILEKTGLRAELENDANCAALGECWLGAAKDENDSAFVVCGTGIGGAIVKDNKVHRGINLHGGEFGYCIMDFDYETKTFKSFSEMGSTGALARAIAKRKGVSESEMNGIKAFELCEEGDEIAKEEVDKYFFNMAIGIYNLQYHYDPEVIVLGGAISERDGYVDEINKRMDEIMQIKNDGKIKPSIRAAKHGNKANLLGALYNYLQQ
ncbi:MAG: ROK family protein [Clostridium sp.]